MLELRSLDLLRQKLGELNASFAGLPPFDSAVDLNRVREVLDEVVERMADNYPYFHPLYAGQMLKPPHPVARLAYAISMFINPNNHALDGGRASSMMEKEAVAEIAKMFGWDTHLGHLASGGTMANLEALWVAGCLHPGQAILASSQAHYTHGRISEVLQLNFESVPVDERARMDVNALEDRLRVGNVGTVVVTAGTTSVGSFDPLPDILALKAKYPFRIHIDAAYGGYFKLVEGLRRDTSAALACTFEADSIVVDPHKHGLQPYGCGCVLFKDPSVGIFYKHDSPYTYFSSGDLHMGEITLECSRAGASAVALWATQKLLPLEPGGEFASDLGKCRQAAVEFFARLKKDDRFLTAMEPEIDIVVWAPKAKSASQISELSQQHFDRAAEKNLHLALASVPADLLKPYWNRVNFDQDSVLCLRSCMMKPEHKEWVGRIWKIVDGLGN